MTKRPASFLDSTSSSSSRTSSSRRSTSEQRNRSDDDEALLERREGLAGRDWGRIPDRTAGGVNRAWWRPLDCGETALLVWGVRLRGLWVLAHPNASSSQTFLLTRLRHSWTGEPRSPPPAPKDATMASLFIGFCTRLFLQASPLQSGL